MKAVLVDHRISYEETKNLENLGCKVLKVPPFKGLYEAVFGHPDMLLNIIDDNTIIVHKNMDIAFISSLKAYGYNVLLSKDALLSKYPFDIILNAAIIDNLFIHNIKYTDNNLLDNLSNKKIKSVKQGYTKCSTAIVSSSAVMTSDIGIAKSLLENKIDVLLLPPGDILLPGLNYGFIGGCCGLIQHKLLGFYGHLDNYSYKHEVYSFLKKHNIEPVFLSNGKLIDRGSILSINI